MLLLYQDGNISRLITSAKFEIPGGTIQKDLILKQVHGDLESDSKTLVSNLSICNVINVEE